MAIGRYTKNLQYAQTPEISLEEAMFVPMQRKAEKDKLMDALYQIDTDVLATDQDKQTLLNDITGGYNQRMEDISSNVLGPNANLYDVRKQILSLNKDVNSAKTTGAYYQANQFYNWLEEQKAQFFDPANEQPREVLNEKWQEHIDAMKAEGRYGAYDPTTGELRDWARDGITAPQYKNHPELWIKVLEQAGVSAKDFSAYIDVLETPGMPPVITLNQAGKQASNSDALQKGVDFLMSYYDDKSNAYARDWAFRGLSKDDLATQLNSVAGLMTSVKTEKGTATPLTSLNKETESTEPKIRNLEDYASIPGNINNTPLQPGSDVATQVEDLMGLIESGIDNTNVKHRVRLKGSNTDIYYSQGDYSKLTEFEKANLEKDDLVYSPIIGEDIPLEKKGEKYYNTETGEEVVAPNVVDNLLTYSEPDIKKALQALGVKPTQAAIDNYKKNLKTNPEFKGELLQLATNFVKNQNDIMLQGITLWNTKAVGSDADSARKSVKAAEEDLLGIKTIDKDTGKITMTPTNKNKLYQLSYYNEPPVTNYELIEKGYILDMVGLADETNMSKSPSGYVVKASPGSVDSDLTTKYFVMPYGGGETLPNNLQAQEHAIIRSAMDFNQVQHINYVDVNQGFGQDVVQPRMEFKTTHTSDGTYVDVRFVDGEGKAIEGQPTTSFKTNNPATIFQQATQELISKANDENHSFINNLNEAIVRVEGGNNGYNGIYEGAKVGKLFSNFSAEDKEKFRQYFLPGENGIADTFDLTNMKVRDVIDLQAKVTKAFGKDVAFGGYQFMPGTLTGLVSRRGEEFLDRYFDEALQDELVTDIYAYAGVYDFLVATGPERAALAKKMMKLLGTQFASLPQFEPGKPNSNEHESETNRVLYTEDELLERLNLSRSLFE